MKINLIYLSIDFRIFASERNEKKCEILPKIIFSRKIRNFRETISLETSSFNFYISRLVLLKDCKRNFKGASM